MTAWKRMLHRIGDDGKKGRSGYRIMYINVWNK